MFSIIKWFLENKIATNLLMVTIIIGGFISIPKVSKEAFPTSDQNFVSVSVTYRGAAPQEVEQQVVVRLEEALSEVEGVYKLTSTSTLGEGVVTVEVVEGYDIQTIMSDIENKVSAINTLPIKAERPVVKKIPNKLPITFFAVYGSIDPVELKNIAYQMRDEIGLLESISLVEVFDTSDNQINIEVSERNLKRFNLDFDSVANAIRDSSLNISAGTISTEYSRLQLTTSNQAYTAFEYAQIPITTNSNGVVVRLGDIADVRDELSNDEILSTLEGQTAINFKVYLDDQSPDLIAGTNNLRNYIDSYKKKLPPGVNLSINYEIKSEFDSRLNLLTENAISGLILVFVVLMLFLRPLIAVWVCVGIVTAFAGTLWLLPVVDVSINMLSMLAFLMVLGIIVDDAIVVGESIYSEQNTEAPGNTKAFVGASKVVRPVLLAIASTIIFFVPLLDVPAESKPFTVSIFFVIVLCLLFSLVESLLILPSHLAHMGPEKESKIPTLKVLAKIRGATAKGLTYSAQHYFQPLLKLGLARQGLTISIFVCAFMISLSILAGGWVKTVFMPKIPNAFINADIVLHSDAPYSKTKEMAERLYEAGIALKQDPELLELNGSQPFVGEINYSSHGNVAHMFIGLTQPEHRILSTSKISHKLQELIGPLDDVKSYSLVSDMAGNTPDIKLDLNIRSNEYQKQVAAVNDVVKALKEYSAVTNIRTSLDAKRKDVKIELKPRAEVLGVTVKDIGNQIRQAYFGEEVQRIARNGEDVRVVLRYPEQDRHSLYSLDRMYIRADNGDEIPLSTLADISYVPGYTKIERLDRRRSIAITANVDDGVDPMFLINDLIGANEYKWSNKHSGFNLKPAGDLRVQEEFGDSFKVNFLIALLAVYALMAIVFRSYGQSMLVLIAIPYGLMGSIWGHLIMGHNLSIMSAMGFLACAGVVVNGNLVLLDRINHFREQGMDAYHAALNASLDRFRPIVLTSLTTFIGLIPILSESSGQAQYLIPMVISLAFGVLLATPITLILVPTLYVFCVKISQGFSRPSFSNFKTLGRLNN